MEKLQRVTIDMLVYLIRNLTLDFSLPKKISVIFVKGSTMPSKRESKIGKRLHRDEKNLSRTEKAKEMGSKIALATFDLQAVMPVPTGQSSAFFYKSRLNCFNFTVSK